ncbi:FUSC family protein [Leucobacter sp. Psy1]|uniref:FUSC family protein n=1 Tax=Leucobacter sp. Psy1 TaxID=2875729 RepID=UPI001CD6153B|nr:FUSC family protein [Leucobacter sp. Psy1]UBH06284.1 FUSC family protein [Leucobacter sp. Psy1]
MPEPAPATGPLRRFVRLGPRRTDHLPAFRISLGLAIPLLLLLATDQMSWAMYAGFGAFTGIYSRYEPTRARFRRQGLMAIVLTSCVAIGATLALAGEHGNPSTGPWVTLLITSLVAGFAAALVTARGIKPAGALFPLFAVAAVAAAPPAAPIWVAVLVAGGSAAGSVLLGLAGHWLGERHPPEDFGPELRHWAARQVRADFARTAIAALLAGIVGLLSGLPFPYWAQIAAIAPLSVPGRSAQVERGLHRVVGTALGIVATAFLLSFPAEAWQLVVWVILLQFIAELFVLRNYPLSLVFITPLALLMVQLAHPTPVGELLGARFLETALGAGVGIGVVIASALWDRRRKTSTVTP